MSFTLLIGHNSFIGRAVAAELRSLGRAAVGTSRQGPHRLDVTDPASVDAAFASVRPVAVVACHGVTDAPSPAEFYAAHVAGTLNVLEAVRRHAPDAAVVLLGSAAEYGPAPVPVREDFAAAPASFYGASKLAQTQLAAVAVAAWGLKVRTARPFNVVGPGLPGQYLVSALAGRLKGLPPGSVFPLRDADATRDFIDVRDVAAAIVRLTAADVPSGAYNVATGIETPVRDVAALLGELAGGMTPRAAEGTGRVNVSRSAGDAGRLRALGWEPRHGWRDAVRAFWAG